jgi:hypothetical protein
MKPIQLHKYLLLVCAMMVVVGFAFTAIARLPLLQQVSPQQQQQKQEVSPHTSSSFTPSGSTGTVSGEGVTPSVFSGDVRDLPAATSSGPSPYYRPFLTPQGPVPSQRYPSPSARVMTGGILVSWLGIRGTYPQIGAEAIRYYNIYRRSAGSEAWQLVGTVNRQGDDRTDYQWTDTSARTGFTYTYGLSVVDATDSEGPIEAGAPTFVPN